MVNANIDAVADIAVAANRQFNDAHAGADTQVGVISSTIRALGVQADAVNIDCGISGQRLALIVMDQNPEVVGIGIGQKDTVGDYELIRQVRLADLSQEDVFDILEARFGVA